MPPPDAMQPGSCGSWPDSYAGWAAACFEQRIAPILRGLAPGGDPLADAWRATCDAGDTPATRARLYPGAFFLLWVQALAGPDAGQDTGPLAAAIELLHNATLVHDDVIDGHAVRRGQATLQGRWGPAAAVLGGDGLQADALVLLAGVDPCAAPVCLRRLGQALREVAIGQWLDEPATWATVPAADRERHWLRVCAHKLAIGHVGAPLAAEWLAATGRVALPASWPAALSDLMTDFSVVSQVINDLGDCFDFAGLHTLSPSGRVPNEEGVRKPTLASIWLGPQLPPDAGAWPPQARAALLARGRADIAGRRTRALASLACLLPDPPPPLRDFFASADLPEAAA